MGRNVLISGASHGIGAATAIAFAKDGCNVGINYHNNRAGAEETAAECRQIRRGRTDLLRGHRLPGSRRWG